MHGSFDLNIDETTSITIILISSAAFVVLLCTCYFYCEPNRMRSCIRRRREKTSKRNRVHRPYASPYRGGFGGHDIDEDLDLVYERNGVMAQPALSIVMEERTSAISYDCASQAFSTSPYISSGNCCASGGGIICPTPMSPPSYHSRNNMTPSPKASIGGLSQSNGDGFLMGVGNKSPSKRSSLASNFSCTITTTRSNSLKDDSIQRINITNNGLSDFSKFSNLTNDGKLAVSLASPNSSTLTVNNRVHPVDVGKGGSSQSVNISVEYQNSERMSTSESSLNQSQSSGSKNEPRRSLPFQQQQQYLQLQLQQQQLHQKLQQQQQQQQRKLQQQLQQQLQQHLLLQQIQQQPLPDKFSNNSNSSSTGIQLASFNGSTPEPSSKEDHPISIDCNGHVKRSESCPLRAKIYGPFSNIVAL